MIFNKSKLKLFLYSTGNLINNNKKAFNFEVKRHANDSGANI